MITTSLTRFAAASAAALSFCAPLAALAQVKETGNAADDAAGIAVDAAAPESAPHNIYFSTSIATRHFHPDPIHNNTQHLLNLEWNYRDNTVVGGAYFKNSYRQPATLIYWGKKYHPFDSAPNAYVKIVGGLIHGYKDEYRDKIPLNKYGTAPAVLPAVGYCYKQLCTEIIVFGTAGAIWTGGVRF